MVTAERVASRVLAARRVAARYYAAADMKDVLLKIRKNTWSSIESIPKLKAVLDYLGGWTLEKVPVLVPLEWPRRVLKQVDEARRLHDAHLRRFVRTLPTQPVQDELYATKVGDIEPYPGGNGMLAEFDLELYVGSVGYRVRAPNGKEFELRPETFMWKRNYEEFTVDRPGDKVLKRLSYGPFVEWLKKETNFMDQVLQNLDMDEHVPAKQRTQAGTGSCAACFRNIKIKQTSHLPLIVKHGFRRPKGYGFLIGQCHGVDFPPFELSPEGTEHYVEALKRHVVDQEKTLKKIADGTLEILKTDRGVVKKGDPSWPRAINGARASIPQVIKLVEADIEGLQQMIRAWKEVPLPEEGKPQKLWRR